MSWEQVEAILRIYSLNPQGMSKRKQLLKAGTIVGVELMRRDMGNAPKLPYTTTELFHFLEWLEKERLAVEGGDFRTAWDIMKERDGNVIQER